MTPARRAAGHPGWKPRHLGLLRVPGRSVSHSVGTGWVVGQYRPGYLLQKTTFLTNKLEMVARVGRYKGSRAED